MNRNEGCVCFNVHSQDFSIEKTFEVKEYGELHSISLCVNNVKVYYKEWNIDLLE